MSKLTALQVAKYFIKKSQEDPEKNLTPLKLQKILYYAQAWYLAKKDEPLFDDVIEAWTHGPVVPSVYHQFKRYGDGSLSVETVQNDEIEEIVNDRELKNFLDSIWTAYSGYEASTLVYNTHIEAPWKEATQNHDIEITKDSMRRFFKQKLLKNGSS